MLRWPFARKKVAPQAAYAIWANSYPPRAHNPLMELEQRTVLSLLPDLTGLTVVDSGCGTGRYLRELKVRGANAIGIDLSGDMLARARHVTPRLLRADMCAMPIGSACVDLVVCGLALGDVPDIELALVEMARVLRPGGSIVYSVVHPIGALRGWSRTFHAHGRQVAIATCWHTAVEHRRACAVAGLRINAWEEPVLLEQPADPAVLVVSASR
jgi:malonyl-CoA O-methyltransferase